MRSGTDTGAVSLVTAQRIGEVAGIAHSELLRQRAKNG